MMVVRVSPGSISTSQRFETNNIKTYAEVDNVLSAAASTDFSRR